MTFERHVAGVGEKGVTRVDGPCHRPCIVHEFILNNLFVLINRTVCFVPISEFLIQRPNLKSVVFYLLLFHTSVWTSLLTTLY